MNDPTQAILVWPGVGIGIIAALVWGKKVFIGLYLAHLSVALFLDFISNKPFSWHEFYISNMFIAVSMMRCYFGAYLIRFFVGYPNALISFKAIFKFFILVAPLVALFSTLTFDITRFFLGFIDSFKINKNSLDWWFGDLTGFIIFAPITLTLISQPKSIWRPRLYTVTLPIIIVLLFVILIFKQALVIDNNNVVDNLKIRNQLVASKLEIHNSWIDNLLTDIYSHFIARENPEAELSSFFNRINNSSYEAKALIWVLNGKPRFVNISDAMSVEQFAKIKKLDLEEIQVQQEKTHQPLGTTQYIQNLDLFYNILKFDNKYQDNLLVYVFYNPKVYLHHLFDTYNLKNSDISLQLQHSQHSIILQNAVTRAPKKPIVISSPVSFNNEIWNIINKPSARQIFQHKSNLSNILAKIGLLFTGLVGVMMLIITGKNVLTDVEVKERTFDLDLEARKLKNNKQQYQYLIEQHPVILWRLNLSNNKMTYISSKVVTFYGYSLDDWLMNENFWINHIHQEDQQRVKSTIDKALQDNSPFELNYRFVKSDYSVAYIKDVVNIDDNTKFGKQLIGLMVDETETHQAKEKQIISENKYRMLFKHASDPLIIIDLNDNSFKDANDKAVTLFGLDNISGIVTLADFSTLQQPDGGFSKKNLRRLLRKFKASKYINFEWTMLNHAHQIIDCDIEVVKLPQNDSNLALVNITDITEIKLHQKKINQLAYYDNLTKLPNREYFYSKFEYFHGLALNKNQYGSIIFLDLDRFKILNDSLGHQAGDKLLKMVANRIRMVTKKADFCARLGGDEFIILNKKFEPTIETTLENSLVKAELILESLNEPYQLGDYEHFITPSIGISYFPFNNHSIDQIIHQADIAMYSSKEKGKNTITIYQDTMVKHVGERLKIEKSIRQALANNEFQIYYQPQFNKYLEIIAVEALLRWDKSKDLKINTENLIDIVEQIGLTHDLGYWVFDQVCSQLEKWQEQGHKLSSVSINVSAKQFHQPLFVEQIKSVIQSYDIQPSQIVLELTEAVIIEDMASLINKLSELKNYGIKASLDDFGTGYSSLAYLKHLPIDQLKIDKLFIHDLSFDNTSQNIVKTIIDLAHSMKIELIAEGIEMQEQYEILKNLGCKNFQGFYFSKPLMAKEVFKT